MGATATVRRGERQEEQGAGGAKKDELVQGVEWNLGTLSHTAQHN